MKRPAVTARAQAAREARFRQPRLRWLVEELANADPETMDPEALRAKLGWFCTAPAWLRALAPAADPETMGPPAFMADAADAALRDLHREAVAVLRGLFPDDLKDFGEPPSPKQPGPPKFGFAPPVQITTTLPLTRTTYSQKQGRRHRIECLPFGGLRATFWAVAVECLTEHGPFVQRCAICRRFFVARTPTETQCRAACRNRYRRQYAKAYYQREGKEAWEKRKDRAEKRAKRHHHRT